MRYYKKSLNLQIEIFRYLSCLEHVGKHHSICFDETNK